MEITDQPGLKAVHMPSAVWVPNAEAVIAKQRRKSPGSVIGWMLTCEVLLGVAMVRPRKFALLKEMNGFVIVACTV